MNNPMEYFREGAEKRKADSLKDKSMYGHGNEVDLEKLENRARRITDSNIYKRRSAKGKPTPRADKATRAYADAVTEHAKMVNAMSNVNQGPRSIPNPNFTLPAERPKRPMSPIQQAMLQKLMGIK